MIRSAIKGLPYLTFLTIEYYQSPIT